MSRPTTQTLFAYAAPALPLAVLQLPVYIFLPTVYATELGLGLTAVGTLLLVARLWDVVSDPVIGLVSDRTTCPLGRRKPFVLIGAPVVMLAAYMLFLPPPGVGGAFLIGWSVLLYTGWTMMILPLNALGAELSPDYHERTRITGWREGFTVVGTLVALGIAGWAQSSADAGDGALAGLAVLGWIVLLIIPIATGIFAWQVADAPERRQTTSLDWRAGLTTLRRNLPFRRLIFAYMLNGVANGLPATLFLLYVQRGLQVPEAAGLLLFLYFVCGVAAVPLWLWLARRIEKHRLWCYAMIWACFFFVLVPMLPAGALWAFAIICVATGAALGADLTLPASMQADAVDADTAETRQAPRTGLYFALWSMATKLALAIAVGVAFPALDLAGFEPDGEGDTGRWALIALYALAPVAFKAAAIGLMWAHPLDRAAQAALRERIAGPDERQGEPQADRARTVS